MTTATIEPAGVPTYVVATSQRPTIVCPNWCADTQEWHLSELNNWEGHVIHRSSMFELAPGFSADIASTTTIDGIVVEPVTIHVHETPEEMSPAQALAAADRLAAIAREAQS